MNVREEWLFEQIRSRGTIRLSELYDRSPWGYHATREAIGRLLETGIVARDGRVVWLPRHPTKPPDESLQKSTKVDGSPPPMPPSPKEKPNSGRARDDEPDPSWRIDPLTDDERERGSAWIKAIREGHRPV